MKALVENRGVKLYQVQFHSIVTTSESILLFDENKQIIANVPFYYSLTVIEEEQQREPTREEIFDVIKKTNEYYKQKREAVEIKSEGVATVLKDNSLVIPNTEEIITKKNELLEKKEIVGNFVKETEHDNDKR